MTQKEIDRIAWDALASLFEGTNMELVPSERTKKELLDDEVDEDARDS